MTDLTSKTIAELRDGIRSREFSALEPPHPGKLRLARMVSAKNLTVRTDSWLEQNH